MNAYWWAARKNFGDELTAVLLDKLADVAVTWVPIEDAEIITVGSILEQVPTGWAGKIVGAGKLHQWSNPDLSHANVLALRGAFSAKNVKGDFALGDPGLLCSEILPFEDEKRFDLTVVPHWSDKTLAKRFSHLDPHVIDPAADVMTIIGDIASSKKIVSSSLHGIIVADSFRIPRRAELFPNIDATYEGGVFKFHDYSTVLGEPMAFGVLHTPDERRLEIAQTELFDVFRGLAGSN